MNTDLRWADPESNEIRTVCSLCLDRCGMIVSRTVNGIKLRGDPSNPSSRGFLCLKGRAALEITDHPDRITYPIQRVGGRGSQRWERVSWEEAIKGISSKLQRILHSYGAESVLVNSLPPKDPVIWLAFAKAIGTPNFFRHDHHICATPLLIADTLTFGRSATAWSHLKEDAEKTRTFVLWGFNPFQTGPARASLIKQSRKAGAKLVVVDPRPIAETDTTHLWMRVRPSTDAALALGMMNIIIKENLYNEEFVQNWTYGFDELARHVEKYPPTKVAEITGIDEASITEAARLIATNKPTAIFTFIGLAMGGNSIHTMRTLGILSAITGNIDITGGNPLKVPPRTETVRLSEELLNKQISKDKFPLLSGPAALTGPYPSGNPSDVINAMITGEPYPVKALLTDTNLLTALEDSKRVKEALLRLDLLVVFELFMTPTAEFADYVLPVTWFPESNAIITSQSFIAPRRRIIKPRGEAREEGETLLEILKSMGLADRLPFLNHRQYLDWRLAPLNLTFDEFAQTGYIVNANTERKYERGLLRTDGKPGFNTPSGKVELYSTILEKYGYDPLPMYQEPSPDSYTTPDVFKDYPLIMITGARHMPFYHGLGLQISKFRRLYPDPILEISPTAAEKVEINEGDWVTIEVPGKNEKVHRKAHIVQGLHDNVVSATGHWYLPEEPDQEKRIWDACINVLTSLRDDWDPIIGGSGSRRLPCRISKA